MHAFIYDKNGIATHKHVYKKYKNSSLKAFQGIW